MLFTVFFDELYSHGMTTLKDFCNIVLLMHVKLFETHSCLYF